MEPRIAARRDNRSMGKRSIRRRAVLPAALTLLAGCGALLGWPLPSSGEGGLVIRDGVRLAKADGTAIDVARSYRASCTGRGPAAVLHLLVGGRRAHWSVEAPVRYLKRHPRLRFPEHLGTGAVLFAAAGGNEASSSEEEARGHATFDRIGCRHGPALSFRVDARLGSELHELPRIRMTGSFGVR